MAKKSNGTRNFYRFVAVIGVVVIGGLGYSFISAAPGLNTASYHKPPPSAAQCMGCHMTGEEKIPIMPHRQMGTCTICHKPYTKE
ncbi:MAG: hypothetical protein ACI8PD_001039 [Nitrospinales bacterium]